MGQSYSRHAPLGNKIFCFHERRKHKNVVKTISRELDFEDALGQVELSILSSKFDEFAGESNSLALKEFEKVMQACLIESFVPESTAVFSRRLFKVFDANNDKMVDKGEFLAGMAIICEGSMNSKLELTFQAYCEPKKPYITRGGMYSLLKSAYIFAIDLMNEDSEEAAELKKHAADTVRKMVDECFTEIDEDNNQVITFDEFSKWATTCPVVCASLGQHEGEINLALL